MPQWKDKDKNGKVQHLVDNGQVKGIVRFTEDGYIYSTVPQGQPIYETSEGAKQALEVELGIVPLAPPSNPPGNSPGNPPGQGG